MAAVVSVTNVAVPCGNRIWPKLLLLVRFPLLAYSHVTVTRAETAGLLKMRTVCPGCFLPYCTKTTSDSAVKAQSVSSSFKTNGEM